MSKMADLDIRITEEATKANMAVGKWRMVESIEQSALEICDELGLGDKSIDWIEKAIWDKAFGINEVPSV